MKVLIAIIVLALVGGGCAGPSKEKVTKGDVDLVDQTVKASSLTQANLELAIACLSGSVPNVIGAIAALNEVRQAAIDSRANSEQLQENFGHPEDPKPYTAENSDAARKQSKEEHAALGGGFWALVLGGLGVLGTAAWAFLRTTAAGKVAEVLVGAGLKVREKAAAGTMTADDVKELYATAVAVAPPKVKAKIEATLVRVKKKISSATAAPPPG